MPEIPQELLGYARYSALGAPLLALVVSKLFLRGNKGAQILMTASATMLSIRVVIGPHLDKMKADLTYFNSLFGR